MQCALNAITERRRQSPLALITLFQVVQRKMKRFVKQKSKQIIILSHSTFYNLSIDIYIVCGGFIKNSTHRKIFEFFSGGHLPRCGVILLQ